MRMSPKLKTVTTTRLFAVIVALLVFLLILLMSEMTISMQQQDAKIKRNNETVAYASNVRAHIERDLNSLIFLSSGLGSYLIVRNNSILGKEVNDILAALYRSSRHIRNIGVAIGYRLTYVYPLEGNEQAIGLYYADQPEQWPVIEKISTTGKPALAGPINLVQGGNGLVYRAPLFVEGTYWGMLSTVIDVDSLFNAIYEQTADSNFTFALRCKDVLGIEGKALFGDQTLFQRGDVVMQEIDIPGGHWVIAVQARLHDSLFTLATGLRLGGSLAGGVIAWLLYGLMRNRSELERLVLFDPLTGLPNRLLLQDRHLMISARQLRSPQQLCAMLFLDLDGFKKINDLYGHKAGDAVLRETAQRMRSMVRAKDTVARWGGDEFIVLLENVSQAQLDILITRIREIVELPIQFEGRQLHVGVSIGLALYPENGAELDEILKTADRNMYQDKSRRKSGSFRSVNGVPRTNH